MTAVIHQIPFSFEFRSTEVAWLKGVARIIGWDTHTFSVRRAEHPEDYLINESLRAEVKTDEHIFSFKYSCRNLPEAYWENLRLKNYTSKEIQHLFSDWNPIFLIPSGKNYTYEADQTEFRENSQSANAWDMREEFLKLKPQCEDAIAFLKKWGRWNVGSFLELREIFDLQQAISKALTSPAGIWLSSELSVPPFGRRTKEYPYFTYLTDSCEIALRLTVTIDLLRNIKFKLCARPDCGQTFAIESKHTKMYCSDRCGHLEVVRRGRKKGKGPGAE